MNFFSINSFIFIEIGNFFKKIFAPNLFLTIFCKSPKKPSDISFAELEKLNLKENPLIISSGIVSDQEYENDEMVYLLEEEIYKFFEDKTNLSKKEKKLYQKLETLSRNFVFKHTRKKPLTNISIVHI